MSSSGVPVTVYEIDAENKRDDTIDRPARDPSMICLGCKKQPVEFFARPCGHPVYCRRCAMNLATGGKCKVCHQFFVTLNELGPAKK